MRKLFARWRGVSPEVAWRRAAGVAVALYACAVLVSAAGPVVGVDGAMRERLRHAGADAGCVEAPAVRQANPFMPWAFWHARNYWMAEYRVNDTSLKDGRCVASLLSTMELGDSAATIVGVDGDGAVVVSVSKSRGRDGCR